MKTTTSHITPSHYPLPDLRLLAGEYPAARADRPLTQAKVEALLALGIDCFVDLTTPLDHLDPYECFLPDSVKRISFPIKDVSIPKHPFEMKQLLDIIEAELAAGRFIYLHCWGGRGRTGTVAGCLLRRRGFENALELVAQGWNSSVKGSLVGGLAPETTAQIEFVKAWQEPNPAHYAGWDRARGALLGLAVGDAVGGAVEFKPRGSFEPVTTLRGGGPHGLVPGEWTDDTSMALCLAESLVKKGFDAGDQMERYLAWREKGVWSAKGYCFDIGNTVSGALSRYRRTGEPFAGATDPQSAGNGSIMRLAPVPIRYWRNLEETIHYAKESSRTTHGAATCLDACALLAAMMARAIAGVSKAEVLFNTGALVKLSTPEIQAIAQGGYREKPETKIRGSGYVVESLEAALWSVYHGGNFREAVLLATNLGDDADTTAAIAGELAGALGGQSTIPQEWLNKLALREAIERMADDLFSPSR